MRVIQVWCHFSWHSILFHPMTTTAQNQARSENLYDVNEEYNRLQSNFTSIEKLCNHRSVDSTYNWVIKRVLWMWIFFFLLFSFKSIIVWQPQEFPHFIGLVGQHPAKKGIHYLAINWITIPASGSFLHHSPPTLRSLKVSTNWHLRPNSAKISNVNIS